MIKLLLIFLSVSKCSMSLDDRQKKMIVLYKCHFARKYFSSIIKNNPEPK